MWTSVHKCLINGRFLLECFDGQNISSGCDVTTMNSDQCHNQNKLIAQYLKLHAIQYDYCNFNLVPGSLDNGHGLMY